ncbi:MAG: type II secretion system protein [Elusimicrobia bacterium]|nr:type II secretion system protein [Elusimicrobiota bacterium]
MNKRNGFTLVELAVIIVIIGVLAAFGVPRFREAVERSKAGEAFNYLTSVRSAQERYHAKNAQYANLISNLDVDAPAPKYFTLGTVTAGKDKWSLTLMRAGAPAGYGDYTVTFSESGYNGSSSTIKNNLNPMVGGS